MRTDVRFFVLYGRRRDCSPSSDVAALRWERAWLPLVELRKGFTAYCQTSSATAASTLSHTSGAPLLQSPSWRLQVFFFSQPTWNFNFNFASWEKHSGIYTHLVRRAQPTWNFNVEFLLVFHCFKFSHKICNTKIWCAAQSLREISSCFKFCHKICC